MYHFDNNLIFLFPLFFSDFFFREMQCFFFLQEKERDIAARFCFGAGFVLVSDGCCVIERDVLRAV